MATSYVLDDLVTFKGVIYRALGASTGIEPPNYQSWALAPKFTTPCVETFWCEHLGPYLAFCVLDAQLPLIRTQVRGDGVVQLRGENFDPASDKAYGALAAAIKGLREQVFDNLDWYIRSTYSTCAILGYYKPLDQLACSGCGCVQAACTCDECGPRLASGYNYEIA